MIYPDLITSLKWKFEYVFFERKAKYGKKKALEKMYNKIVDVIYKTFTRKQYFVKMSQSQKDTCVPYCQEEGGKATG